MPVNIRQFEAQALLSKRKLIIIWLTRAEELSYKFQR